MGKEIKLGIRFYGKVDEFAKSISGLESKISKLNRRFATFNNGMSALQSQTSKASKELANFNKAQQWIDKSFEKGSVAHKKYTSTLKQVEGSLVRQSAAIKDAGGDYKTFIKDSDRLSKTQKIVSGEMKITKKGFEESGFAAEKSAKKTSFYGRDLTKAGKSAKTAGKEIKEVGKKTIETTSALKSLAGAMKSTMAYGMASAAIYGVIRAIGSAIDVIFDFDQALKNLQAITGATDSEIIVLGETIRRVASETKYSTKEVADAAVILGQAGFTAEESIDAVGAVSLLATGTLSDMTTAADLVTTAVRAFGINASDSSRIVDIFASAVNKSKLTVNKLNTAFNYIAPIAHNAGLSLEETAAGAMLLANRGMRASTIGTGLRQVLSRLISPTNKLRSSFAAVGADMSKLNPKTASFKTIIGELTRVVPDAQAAFELFGLRGAAAVSALTEAGAEGFQKMLTEVYNVGTAHKMASKQMEGLGVMSKNLMDKIGLLAITIGESGLTGVFRIFYKVTRPVVDLLTEMAGSTIGKIIIGTTALTTAMILLKVAFSKIVIELAAVIFGYSAMSVKAMVAAKGAGILRVAIVALSKAFNKLWLQMLKNPYTAILIGVSLVIVAISTWVAKIANATNVIEANIISVNKQVQTLESYRSKLAEAEKGSLEYSSVMGRLLNDYPKLRSSVDLATMSFADEGKALDKLIKNKHDEKIASLINLYDEYGNKIDRAKLATGLYEIAVDGVLKKIAPLATKLFGLKGAIGFVSKAIKSYYGSIGAAVDFVIGKVVEGVEATQEMEAMSMQQAQALKILAGEVVEYGVSAGSTLEDIAGALGKHTDMAEDKLSELSVSLKKYLDDTAEAAVRNASAVGKLNGIWAEIYQKVDDSRKEGIIKEYKAFQEKEALYLKDAAKHSGSLESKNQAEEQYKVNSEARFKAVLEGIIRREEISIDITRDTNERKLELLDGYIEQEVEKYDIAQVKFHEAKNKELNSFIGTEEQKLELINRFSIEEEALHKNSLQKLISLEENKIVVLRDKNYEKLKNTGEYYKLVAELAQRGHDNILGMLDTRLKRELIRISSFAMSEQQRTRVLFKTKQQYYKDVSAESNRHFNELTKIVNETYDGILTKITTSGESADKKEKEIFEAKKKRNDEIKKLYDERSAAYKKTIDSLISEEERLTGAIRDAQEERADITKTGDDLIRELNQKLMTDLEVWNEEKLRADELLAKSNTELQAGNIEKAGEYAKEARGIYQGLAKEVKDESGNTIMSVAETVKVAVAGVANSTSALQAIFSSKIGVFEEELGSVRTRIKETESAFNSFKEKIASFNKDSKLRLDVTPTLKALDRADKAVKAYIKTLKDIPKTIETAIIKTTVERTVQARQGGGEIIKMAFGGHVPGSGSGDTVPAMLEPGEFVQPKATVKKYGKGLFEALRSRTIPKEKIQSLIPGMQTGGMVSVNAGVPVKMATGGTVPSDSSNGTIVVGHSMSDYSSVIDNLISEEKRLADETSKIQSQSTQETLNHYNFVFSQIAKKITMTKQEHHNGVELLKTKRDFELNLLGEVHSKEAELSKDGIRIHAEYRQKMAELDATYHHANIKTTEETYDNIVTVASNSYSSINNIINGSYDYISDVAKGTTSDVETWEKQAHDDRIARIRQETAATQYMYEAIATAAQKSTAKIVDAVASIPFIVRTKVEINESEIISDINNIIRKLASIPKNIKTTHTTVEKTVQAKQGGGEIMKMAFGGHVPGSGSGDTVPAMLEPGEFVQPKSVVKKYGLNFFEALRSKLIPKEKIQSLIPGLKMGGFVGGLPKASVAPQRMQSGGEVQSKGELYTINFNLNNKSHQLYGKEDAINGLVKNLRRSQLVTV